MANRPSAPFLPTRHRTLLRLAAALLIGPLLITTTTAQELRLHDGRVLVGKLTKKDQEIIVATRDGNVTVSSDAISKQTSIKELRQKLRERAKRSDDSSFAQLQLGIQARDYGLERDMWRHLDRALSKLPARKQDGEPSPVERRLRDVFAQLEPELLPRELRNAPSKKRILHLLRAFRANTTGSRAAALEELLVREPQADQELRQQARRNPNARQRTAALAALQRRKLNGNDRFVIRTAVLDRSKNVRAAAIDLARPTANADLVTYMAAGLGHSNGKVRVRTAEALAGLAHPSAIPLLVKAGPLAGAGLAGGGDGSTRGHVAFLQQQAYIRDFDVEVAQAAFIADPKVDVLQSGTVLDVRVAGVFEVRTIVRVYRTALKQLTSKDPGGDPRRWGNWLSELPVAASTGEKK